MKATQAYRFALDPSDRTAGLLGMNAGAARFAYNWGLALVKDRLDGRAADPDVVVPWNLYALRREWNQAKPEVAPWWRSCSKEAYNTGLDSLARALANYSASKKGARRGRRVGFPRFKKRDRATPSIRFTTGAIRVEADGRHITLPRVGLVRTAEHTGRLARRLAAGTARILSATVTRKAGRWYCSFTVEVERADPDRYRPGQSPRQIGVDLGIKTFAVCSDGRTFASPDRSKRRNGGCGGSTRSCTARRSAPPPDATPPPNSPGSTHGSPTCAPTSSTRPRPLWRKPSRRS